MAEILTYEADGLAMQSHLFLPTAATGRVPGVLVFPEAFGLGHHALGVAERLAGLGYAALACDLHGQGYVEDNLTKVMPMLAPLRADKHRIRARARGGFDALATRAEVDTGRIAAIGFCFGGMMALELARSGADIVASIGFHSTLSTPDPADAQAIKGKVLALIGADDPGVDAGQRADFEAEMRAARVDWQLHVYGGVVHSYTDPAADARGRPEALRYDARADARSWASMLALFDEVFAGKGTA